MTDSKASKGHQYIFPAIRGIQAGREFYVAMCPLRLIPRIFLYDEEGTEIPPAFRAQRTLNSARVPDIAQYIVENPKGYVFSSLTASVNGEISFEPTGPKDSDVGLMKIPMAATFILNDGQHRRAAIEEALKHNHALGDETVSVVFFPDQGLKRSQQMFADLNRHAMKPTRSLSILYDYKDPMSGLARKIAESVPEFKGQIEQEKTTIPNRSVKLFTLSSLYEGCLSLLGKAKRASVSKEEEAFAVAFWREVAGQMPDWGRAHRREVSTAELRANYVHSHGIIFHALGIVGKSLREKFPKEWKNLLRGLRDISWERSENSEWEGRTTFNGRLSKSTISVRLTAIYIKKKLGLELDESEAELEGANAAKEALVA